MARIAYELHQAAVRIIRGAAPGISSDNLLVLDDVSIQV